MISHSCSPSYLQFGGRSNVPKSSWNASFSTHKMLENTTQPHQILTGECYSLHIKRKKVAKVNFESETAFGKVLQLLPVRHLWEAESWQTVRKDVQSLTWSCLVVNQPVRLFRTQTILRPKYNEPEPLYSASSVLVNVTQKQQQEITAEGEKVAFLGPLWWLCFKKQSEGETGKDFYRVQVALKWVGLSMKVFDSKIASRC